MCRILARCPNFRLIKTPHGALQTLNISFLGLWHREYSGFVDLKFPNCKSSWSLWYRAELCKTLNPKPSTPTPNQKNPKPWTLVPGGVHEPLVPGSAALLKTRSTAAFQALDALNSNNYMMMIISMITVINNDDLPTKNSRVRPPDSKLQNRNCQITLQQFQVTFAHTVLLLVQCPNSSRLQAISKDFELHHRHHNSNLVLGRHHPPPPHPPPLSKPREESWVNVPNTPIL